MAKSQEATTATTGADLAVTPESEAPPRRRSRLSLAFPPPVPRWVERPALSWLAVTVAMSAAVGATVPRAGVDGSWITAINVAHTNGMRFGRDVLFTFGPWGFLERPLLVNNLRFVLGLLFAVAAVAALFCATYACLRLVWRPAVAAPLAAAATIATPVADPGLRFLCAALIAGLFAIDRQASGRPERLRDAWPVAGLAAFAALMLQVKFSEGMALTAVAGIVAIAVRGLPALARNSAAAATGFVATFTVAWLAAGQALADLPQWLRGSWQLASGYQEAMAIERTDGVFGYVALVLVVLVAGAVAVRVARGYRGVVAFGAVLLVLAALEFGFKHGFTRHDAGHEVSFLIIGGFLLIGLSRYAPRPLTLLVPAGLALALVPPGLAHFDPFSARDRWRTTAEAVLNDKYRADLLDSARRDVRSQYGVSPALVAETVGHPVSVDPWEATAAWAYSMKWGPVPVFQSYSAYTAELDDLNARAIAAAPADQLVLREDREMFDDRNLRWETPRYLLALACHYTPEAKEGRWSLLRRGPDRCEEARAAGTSDVSAGEAVAVPAAAPGEIVVARFTPRPDGLLSTVGNAVLKDWTPLWVTADGERFRLPEGLAGGPLMVSVPTELGWAAPFDGFRYTRIAFERPGTVAFEVLSLRPGA